MRRLRHFKSLWGKQEPSEESFSTDATLDGSLPMEVDSDQELLVTNTEEEELSFYKEDHMEEEEYS